MPKKTSAKKKYLVGRIDYSHLINLNKELKSALKKSRTVLVRTALIKFFELAFEQSWKVLKKVLMQNYSIETQGSKDVYREAAKLGLIEDPEKWFEFVEDRNETVHSYDEETAKEITDDLKDFVIQLDYLIAQLKELK